MLYRRELAGVNGAYSSHPSRPKTRCPHCGGGERLGIWFPRRKLEILDKIIAAGDVGAHFDGVDPRTLRIHIYQINGMFEETDWWIRSAGWGTKRYRLERCGRVGEVRP